MRIGASLTAAAAQSDKKSVGIRERRFTMRGYDAAQTKANDVWFQEGGNRMQEYAAEKSDDHQSEAEKIYQAVAADGNNPTVNIRQASKVPYGYLAKDGVITYNGVTFVCDEKTNSICLGDMSDKKNVLNIPLSGGGYLRVNRDNIGDLSKAIGMFSPEDVNRILRAIAQDTKIQSMQQELEDMENSVGASAEQTQTNKEESEEIDVEIKVESKIDNKGEK